MESGPAPEILNVYYKRYEILSLIQEGTIEKSELEEQVSASRPTIDRSYRELEELGVLDSTGTSYELTKFGDLVCQEFVRTQDRVRTLNEVDEVLSNLPADDPIDMRLLEDADIHHAEEHAPQEPFTQIVDLIVGSAEMKGYSSTVLPHYVDIFYSLAIEDELEITFVFTDDVLQTLQENYPDKFADFVEVTNTTVYGTQNVKPYGLLITEEAVAVPIGDCRDRLQAVIINTTPAAFEWGTEYFDQLIRSAEAYSA